jgi:TRAP-type C4-dicarboxylate transport system permease small subunit
MTALSVAAFAYLIPTAVFFMLEQDKIASSAMQMPMSWLFAAVPIGCAMMVFRLGVNFVRLMKGGDVK